MRRGGTRSSNTARRCTPRLSRRSDLRKTPRPSRQMCCLNRAACNMQVHEYGQVIADCCQVLDWDADNVTAYLRRGLAYEGSRRFSKAAADMREALSIQSASGGLRDTQAKKAKECLERCVKAEPDLRAIPIPHPRKDHAAGPPTAS